MGLVVEGPTTDKLVEEVHLAVLQGTTYLQALKTKFSGLQEKIEATPVE